MLYRYNILAGILSICAFFTFAQESINTPISTRHTPNTTSENVTLIADEIREDRISTAIEASGNVEVRYQGRTLKADRLTLLRNTNSIRASGNVTILEADGSYRTADEFEIELSLSDGYATNFSTLTPDGGRTTATAAISRSDGLSILERVVYSACQACGGNSPPTWKIRARRAIMNKQSEQFSYRDAVLEIVGLPVFYLPYFAHADPSSGRKSGFLPSIPGSSSKLGLFYEQPYYLTLSRSSDITVTPKMSANVNPLLNLDYRKRFWSGQIEVNTSFTHEYLFDGEGNRANSTEYNNQGNLCQGAGSDSSYETDCESSWRGHVFAKGKFELTPTVEWGFGVEHMTDDLYTRRYNIRGENERRGRFNSQPRRLLSQLYLNGNDEKYYADIVAFEIQGLREDDDDDLLPIGAPVFFAERLLDLGLYGIASAEFSGTFLNRANGDSNQRLTFGLDWSRKTVLPFGFVLEPFVEGRADSYDIQTNEIRGTKFARTVGALGTRFEFPLVRRNRHSSTFIKPFAMVSYGTANPNNNRIPNEDTLLYEFDEAFLLEANAFANYDIYEGDGTAALGLSTQVRWNNGVSLTGMAGRRWRSRSDPNLSLASNLDGTASDWVGSFIADYGTPFHFSAKVRLDDDSLALNRIDTTFSTRHDLYSLDLVYYKIDNDISILGRPDEGIFIDGSYQLIKNFYLNYRRHRNIEENTDANHSIGFAYEDRCSRFEIAFERNELRDRTLGASDSIQFKFSLKTLGEMN